MSLAQNHPPTSDFGATEAGAAEGESGGSLLASALQDAARGPGLFHQGIDAAHGGDLDGQLGVGPGQDPAEPGDVGALIYEGDAVGHDAGLAAGHVFLAALNQPRISFFHAGPFCCGTA